VSAVGLYSRGRGPNGHRLANPRDPIVRRALERGCIVCAQPPGAWCIGVAEGKTKGRPRSRLHFDRCDFVEVPA
jgi:hypothetical protein